MGEGTAAYCQSRVEFSLAEAGAGIQDEGLKTDSRLRGNDDLRVFVVGDTVGSDLGVCVEL